MSRRRTERNKSRRKTPWDGKDELTPTQEFISRQYEEHYMQRHPKLDETGEVELINSFRPSKCPFCGSEKFLKYGRTRIGAVRHSYQQQVRFLTSIRFQSVNGSSTA